MLAIHRWIIGICDSRKKVSKSSSSVRGLGIAERYRHGIGLVTAFCVIWLAWNNKKRHSFHGQVKGHWV
jgi:hypothetical protein